MRRALDILYAATLWLAALCLGAIALMVGAQLAGRIIDALLKMAGRPPYGFVILSLAEIAGYLLAAASFLALAGTLKAGAHIRVTMALGALPSRARKRAELGAFGAAALFCAYMTWQVGLFAWFSYRFNEVSPGLVRVPLFVPQGAMALGLLVLTVALLDEWAGIWRRGRPSFRSMEETVALGREP